MPAHSSKITSVAPRAEESSKLAELNCCEAGCEDAEPCSCEGSCEDPRGEAPISGVLRCEASCEKPVFLFERGFTPPSSSKPASGIIDVPPPSIAPVPPTDIAPAPPAGIAPGLSKGEL